MLRPAYAEGGQLDGGGIDCADGPLPEPVREPGVVPAGGQELGILFRERFIDLPEKFLGHVRVAGLVGVREAIAAWRSAAAELFQCSGMVGKAVADVVQAQRVGQMGIDHGNDMNDRVWILCFLARFSMILSGIQLVIWARTDIVCLVGVMASPMVAWWLPLRCP